jgi:uncharacterized membrane protein YgcG
MISLHPNGRARRGEAFIRSYTFPRSVMRKVSAAHPELGPTEREAVERGLREWLICCAHRDGGQLGMPSAAVDWAWHEFILNTPEYHAFCRRAYGEYLHHVPEADMGVSMRIGLQATVRAWDRSTDGRTGEEPTLWELDDRLGHDEPIGVTASDLRLARQPTLARRRWWQHHDAGYGAMVAGGHRSGHGGGHGGFGGGCGGGGGGCGGGGCGGGG